MTRNLRALAMAGAQFVTLFGGEAASAQKTGGIFKMYSPDSPARPQRVGNWASIKLPTWHNILRLITARPQPVKAAQTRHPSSRPRVQPHSNLST
jgi:hypothetical protein